MSYNYFKISNLVNGRENELIEAGLHKGIHYWKDSNGEYQPRIAIRSHVDPFNMNSGFFEIQGDQIIKNENIPDVLVKVACARNGVWASDYFTLKEVWNMIDETLAEYYANNEGGEE